MNEDEEEFEIKQKLIKSNEMNTKSTKIAYTRNSLDKQDVEMQEINSFQNNSQKIPKRSISFQFVEVDESEIKKKSIYKTNPSNIYQSLQNNGHQKQDHQQLIKETSNSNEIKKQFILTRYLQDIWSGINLACFCYFYCATVSNSIPKWPFSGIVAYAIGSMTNLLMGSSRYVVYVPSFLAIAFVRTLSQQYNLAQINIITAVSGVYLYLFSRYLDIQRLIFFVPAIVLLGYVYSIVFQFFFNYIDFSLGFHKFNEIGDYFERIKCIFNNFELYSLFTVALTSILVVLFLIGQLKYTKYPWLCIFLLVSLIIGYLVVDESKRFDVFEEFQLENNFLWNDVLTFLIKPITIFSTFKFILLTEALQLAVLIYLESLFSLNFSEKECSDRDIQPYKEGIVLSISNIISGLFCGIPVSAGIFSTTLNGVLIRRNSRNPQFISLILTISTEIIIVYFQLTIPYICFASVLIGVSIFTLYMNLFFHANATSRNIEVWTQAIIGFFYNPIISAILSTSYFLLQNELSRYTLQRRSIYGNATPNLQCVNDKQEKEQIQTIQLNTIEQSQNEISEQFQPKQTLRNRLTQEPYQLTCQNDQMIKSSDTYNQNLIQNQSQQIMQNNQKYKKIVEKYNMLNDEIVQMHDLSQTHPSNFEESYLLDQKEEEFTSNKFMLGRYNEQSEELQQYKNQGLENFLRIDVSFLVQVIEGEITCDYLKYIQEQIGSKLYLSLEKYKGIILKFQNITFYDMNSLFQTKVLMSFLSKKYLPVLVTGMPEQLAEDLFALNPQMFKADSIILELKK